MSFLSDIHAHWAADSTLNTALPATQVYTGIAPETLSFPYAVITAISSVPTFTTDKPYWEGFRFQISIFDTDPDNVDSLTTTVQNAFDYQTIGSSTISCERENYIFTTMPDTPLRVYMAMIEYVLNANRSLP